MKELDHKEKIFVNEQGLQRPCHPSAQNAISAEERAKRHALAAQKAATEVEGVMPNSPRRRVDRIAVVGAGTMGSGIAMSFLQAGIPVTLLETEAGALSRGVERISTIWRTAIQKGKLSEEIFAARMAMLTPTLDYEDLRSSDLIIEAVFEEIAVKQQVFETLETVAKAGAILASNTSTLDINRIAAFTTRPHDVLGLHFFSPANVMRLLEIVRGRETNVDVLATCMDLANSIGKTAVISGVCDGFIGNRMIAHYTNTANRLVVEGATPQQVDQALEEWGMAMGPFRMMDLAGLDIGYAIRRRREAEHPYKDFRVVTDAIFEAGRLGQKSGAGWYRYENDSRVPTPDPTIEPIVAEYRRANQVVPRPIEKEEIVQRCIFSLVNEGARVLEEGIARRASDIDLVYMHGYGFPQHRGGPMFYADTVGLKNVRRAILKFASAEGPHSTSWQLAPLLEHLAAEGGSFN